MPWNVPMVRRTKKSQPTWSYRGMKRFTTGCLWCQFLGCLVGCWFCHSKSKLRPLVRWLTVWLTDSLLADVSEGGWMIESDRVPTDRPSIVLSIPMVFSDFFFLSGRNDWWCHDMNRLWIDDLVNYFGFDFFFSDCGIRKFLKKGI